MFLFATVNRLERNRLLATLLIILLLSVTAAAILHQLMPLGLSILLDGFSQSMRSTNARAERFWECPQARSRSPA